MLHKHDFQTCTDVDRRGGDRLPIRFVANIQCGPGELVSIEVVNISRLGFMARCDAFVVIGSTITLTAPNGETCPAHVRWAHDGHIGCRFQEALSWEDVLGLGLEELDAEDVPGPELGSVGY